MGVSVIWMSGAILSFCLMAIGGRELSSEINTFQTLFFRSLIGFIIITIAMAIVGDKKLFTTNRYTLHINRNIFHFIGQYAWFVGIGLLPLTVVFALEFTVPLWTVLVAALVLKEKITKIKVFAITMGLVGVLLILQPGLEILDATALIVLASALFYAISHVNTKMLSITEDPLTILFYMCLIQLPIGFFLSLFYWVTPDVAQLFWLVIVGISALSAHYCLTSAMRHAEVGVVLTLDFLRLPIIAVIGVMFYNEQLELAVLLGAFIMLLGNFANIYKTK